MELYIYDTDLILCGVIDKITSLLWMRRYWNCGEFKLLVPFTDQHIKWLQKDRLVMKRGDKEAGQIKYIHISKNAEGIEEIEVTGRFLSGWLDKRIVLRQIIANDNSQNLMRRYVTENITNPAQAARKIPRISAPAGADLGSGKINHSSEPFTTCLLGVEGLAKAAKLGFRIATNVKTRQHQFEVFKGRDLTADQQQNPPCIFSQEFDNVNGQEYTNSVENLKSVAYVGGEEKEGVSRQIVEVGSASGLERDEIFINATDITQTYREGETEITMPLETYLQMLYQRGVAELEQYAETLAFSSSINTNSNLRYKEDFDIGDRVTCINKRWGIKINMRITEITEIYQQNVESLEVTFGESLPTLLEKIRKIRG